MKLNKQRIRSTVLCGLFVALLTISAWIQIPGAVPFTLQTMVVSILACLLGLRRSLLTIFIYIGLGMIGLPVFSSFSGGIGVLLDVTGGYLIGFFPMAALISISTHFYSQNRIAQIVSMFVGTILCYLTGAIWLAIVYTSRGDVISISTLLSLSVLPFILPECAKIISAIIVINRLKPLFDHFQ